jgi:putative addiction module component (TIGR02574 family)
MSAPYDQVLQAALALPEADRADLVDALLTSFTPENPPPLSEHWLREIERRSQEYDEGKATVVSWTHVKQAARKKHGFHD